jgi:hypothetical protein
VTERNRELLFGLVALKHGFLDEEGLVAEFQAWTRNPSQSFGDHLVAAGSLSPNRREAIAILVARELVLHAGSAETCLKSFPAPPGLIERLTALST